MLKITQHEAVNEITLNLEGRLVGPWVAELEDICARCYAAARGLRLRLADVEFADRNGIALLRSLRANGVELAGSSPFLEEQMRTVAPGKRD